MVPAISMVCRKSRAESGRWPSRPDMHRSRALAIPSARFAAAQPARRLGGARVPCASATARCVRATWRVGQCAGVCRAGGDLDDGSVRSPSSPRSVASVLRLFERLEVLDKAQAAGIRRHESSRRSRWPPRRGVNDSDLPILEATLNWLEHIWAVSARGSGTAYDGRAGEALKSDTAPQRHGRHAQPRRRDASRAAPKTGARSTTGRSI